MLVNKLGLVLAVELVEVLVEVLELEKEMVLDQK